MTTQAPTTMTLALGYEELERAGGDLQTALAQESLRAEVVLAWLDHAMTIEPERSRELIDLVAAVLDESEKERTEVRC